MNLIKILLLNFLLVVNLLSATFEEDILGFDSSNFKSNETLITQLCKNYPQEPRVELILRALSQTQLYLYEQNLYYMDETLKSVLDDTILTQEAIKIRTNNRLRAHSLKLLSELELFSSDKTKKLNAIKNIIQNKNIQNIELLSNALHVETDEDIKSLLDEALNIHLALFKEGQTQLDAIVKLGNTITAESLSTLKQIKTEDEQIQKSLQKAISSIQSYQNIYDFLEMAFFGLSLGSVLLLCALGLAISFGVMKVINMAHGELIMIGAYTTFVIQNLMPNSIEYSLLIAMPVAFLVSGAIGVLIERLVIRHLYGRVLETLLATFGVSLILQQIVRSVFSPLNQEVKSPSWMSGAWEINSFLSLTYNRLYIIIFALVVFVALLLVMKKTSLGLKVRAISQNRPFSRAMGIRSNYIDAITFGIGSGIAGVAGVALSQLTNVGPNLGQAYIIDSFMVVVFGGVGNLWGTLVGAFTLGGLNKFIEPYSGAVLAKVFILVLIILFIQKRPRGLFPQKGRDAQE